MTTLADGLYSRRPNKKTADIDTGVGALLTVPFQTHAMIEDRRNRLASIIVGVADGGVRDLAQIKEVATRVMMHPDEPKQLNGNQADA